MKKFITLLLVLTGMVCTASADEHTVYFKPNSGWSEEGARFALYMFNDNNSTKGWVDFVDSDYSGIYKATYNTDFYAESNAGIIICRMDPKTTDNDWINKWAQSVNLAAPTSDIYYDTSSNSFAYDATWDPSWSYIYTYTPSGHTYYLSGEGSSEHMPNYMDDNSEAGVYLVSNGDFTYSRTVTGNVIPAGTYGFKVYDDSNNWYSDDNVSTWNPWSVSGISTTEDAVYDIEYTFNFFTGVGTATATKTGNAKITTKYVIAGTDALMGGHGWDTSGDYNELEITDDTGTLTLNNLSLTGGTSYYYKAVKLLCNNGTKYKSIWYAGDNSEYYIGRTGIYNATFSCTISTQVSTITNMTELDGYYIYGGSGSNSWTLGERMTENEGVYTYTFNNASDYSFVITQNTNLKTDGSNQVNSWSSVIRPNNSNAQVNIGWSNNQNGDTENADVENDKWYINYSGYVTLTYDPTNETWSAAPYIVKDFTDAPSQDDSYLTTFSNTNYAVAIPDGVTAYYADKANSGSGVVKMVAFENGIAANTGAFLKADEAKEYHFTPATTTDVVASNNLFVAGNGVPSESSAYRYVFAKQDDDLGFYKMGSSFSVDMTGKAYLESATSLAATGARVAIVFDDDVNGINTVSRENVNNNEYYNLAGQRVAQPAKGLYIVNGKKVIMK